MQKILISIILVTISTLSVQADVKVERDYPTSPMEKEQDKLGSALGGDGVVFRPTKEKSTDSRVKIGNVNKYLYQASLQVLKVAPIISSDSYAGVITTDWYLEKETDRMRYRVNVYIKDDVISPEAIEVKAFEQEKHFGDWKNYSRSDEKAAFLEEKILITARRLYQDSKR